MSGVELQELRSLVYQYNEAAAVFNSRSLEFSESFVAYSEATKKLSIQLRDMTYLLCRIYGVPKEQLPEK